LGHRFLGARGSARNHEEGASGKKQGFVIHNKTIMHARVGDDKKRFGKCRR
jgi:hypothetical protein